MVGEDDEVEGGDEAPHDLIGARVNVPDKQWPGYETATTSTMVTIVAYAPTRDAYIVNTKQKSGEDWGHCALSYDQLRAHFTQQIKARVKAPKRQCVAPRA
eukprot:2804912-Prymnesium_polylepis.2